MMNIKDMRYTVTKNNKTLALVLMAIGVVSIAYGFSISADRAWANLLLSNFYFLAVALAATFFLALQYVAEVGWSVQLTRVFQAIGTFIPYAGVGMLIIFVFGHHHLYEWTHAEFYQKFLADGKTPNPDYDEILVGKSGYLNIPFFITRMVVYVIIWSGLTYLLRKESLLEDIDGDIKRHKKMIKYSAIFLVTFAITSSTSAWDFIMSLDPHWFSTLFGWYTFMGLFVSGLAVMSLFTVYLKKNGYLENVNENHLHDLGKYMFAFSIFWTYLWFAQFMLIWYANLPEEITYFMARFGHYKWLFIANVLINFFIPFLTFMKRDSKRRLNLILIIGVIIFCGHWIDVYLMIMPATIGQEWHIGIPEIGTTLGFAGAFIWVVLHSLSKTPMVPQKHPMMGESLHFHL
jgi:hypothetical protein